MWRIEQVCVLSLAVGGCSLMTSLDDLRGGSSNDASAGDAGNAGAPAYVQGKTLVDVENAKIDWSDSVTLPGVHPGDAIVVGVVAFQDGQAVTAIAINDNQGDTFTSTNIVAFDQYPNAIVACAFGVKGGPTTINIVVTGPKVEGLESVALEYSGVSKLDAWAGRGGGTSGTDGMASGPATTTTNDLIVGIGYSPSSVSAGSGFTKRDSQADILAEDRLATSSGSQAATETMTANNYWIMMMAALSP
jgi:hypothetical protein